MEAALMIKTSLALMTISGLGGVVMAIAGMSRPAGWLAISHALLAGAGLTLITYLYFTSGLPIYASWALLCLLIATFSGVRLSLGLIDKSAPVSRVMGLVHAATAIAGYVLMLMAVRTPG